MSNSAQGPAVKAADRPSNNLLSHLSDDDFAPGGANGGSIRTLLQYYCQSPAASLATATAATYSKSAPRSAPTYQHRN